MSAPKEERLRSLSTSHEKETEKARTVAAKDATCSIAGARRPSQQPLSDSSSPSPLSHDSPALPLHAREMLLLVRLDAVSEEPLSSAYVLVVVYCLHACT